MNRLARESSPYLRQHQHNPVDWYPWGPEALERARAEDRPILLSVGYSACHWCHVMERESFEDAATAALMNRLYVCVKVDREERPDLDHLYQAAVQILRQSGGWPLTAFLAPDGRPFFAGTYFPPEPRWGMPSFSQVLEQVAVAWRDRRGELERSAEALAAGLRRLQQADAHGDLPPPDVLEGAAEFLLGRVDDLHGGFGSAPKFPSPSNLWTLWRRWSRAGDPRMREAVVHTLRCMADGGIRDHAGGGFHRYSTDREWLVPHFEKMLYDNALLVPIYLAAFRETGDAELREAATDALEWALREMRSPAGAFYAATDADSGGEEGAFFTWTPAEVAAAVGDAALAAELCAFYDVTAAGNWEGRSILRRRRGAVLPEPLRAARARVLAARSARVAPMRDDKVIVAWNAWMIAALVEAWGTTGEGRWLDAARAAASELLTTCVRDGRLQHSACAGDVRGPGFLDDHAALGDALLRLFEATSEPRWRDAALALAMELQARFADPAGAWFMAPDDAEPLLIRPRDATDSAVPCGTGLAAAFLLRLHLHDPDPRWLAGVERCFAAHASQLEQNPYGSGSLLGAFDTWQGGWEEVVLAGSGDERLAMERTARAAPGVDRVVLALEALPASHPAALGRGAVAPTAWVCRGRSCSLPVHDAAALEGLLRERS